MYSNTDSRVSCQQVPASSFKASSVTVASEVVYPPTNFAIEEFKMTAALTEYELLRQQIQKRNAERLRSLGVKSTVDELTSTVTRFKEQE